MPSAYLSAADLNTYGVPNATNPQILQASALIDAYLKRPEGLVWLPDYAGNPCYMAGLSSHLPIKTTAPISPGTNVVVPIGGGGQLGNFGTQGDVVILDRLSATQGQTGVAEACVIVSTTNSSITLATVANAHTTGALMEFGLCIREQKMMPARRSLTRLSRWPICRIISGQGSYRYGRRSDQTMGLFSDQTVMSLLQTFGGPPEWTAWDVTQADFNSITNEIWIPSGIFLAYYSDVRVYYVAGWPQNSLPPIIKQVCASIISANINTASLTGGIKMAKAGDTALTRFENTVLDADMREQLELFKVRLFV